MFFMLTDGVFNTVTYQDVTTPHADVQYVISAPRTLHLQFIAAPPTPRYVCACVVHAKSKKLWTRLWNT